MDEEAKKRKLQFRYRRDIGENTNIASLPAGLIEAATAMLKDKKPEPLKLKGGKNARGHINLNPSDDQVGPGVMSLKREDIEVMVGNLIEGGFSDEEIVAVLTETIDEGVRLKALGDELGITKPSPANAHSSRLSRLMDTLGNTVIQGAVGIGIGGMGSSGSAKMAALGAATTIGASTYARYRGQKKHRENVTDTLKGTGIKP